MDKQCIYAVIQANLPTPAQKRLERVHKYFEGGGLFVSKEWYNDKRDADVVLLVAEKYAHHHHVLDFFYACKDKYASVAAIDAAMNTERKQRGDAVPAGKTSRALLTFKLISLVSTEYEEPVAFDMNEKDRDVIVIDDDEDDGTEQSQYHNARVDAVSMVLTSRQSIDLDIPGAPGAVHALFTLCPAVLQKYGKKLVSGMCARMRRNILGRLKEETDYDHQIWDEHGHDADMWVHHPPMLPRSHAEARLILLGKKEGLDLKEARRAYNQWVSLPSFEWSLRDVLFDPLEIKGFTEVKAALLEEYIKDFFASEVVDADNYSDEDTGMAADAGPLQDHEGEFKHVRGDKTMYQHYYSSSDGDQGEEADYA